MAVESSHFRGIGAVLTWRFQNGMTHKYVAESINVVQRLIDEMEAEHELLPLV